MYSSHTDYSTTVQQLNWYAIKYRANAVDIQPACTAGQRDSLTANTAVCCTVTSLSQPMHILVCETCQGVRQTTAATTVLC